MKNTLLALSALLVFLALGAGHAAWAQSDQPGYFSASDQPDESLLSPEELDDLLAPIALYPDPLIAQILPAATFIDQIDEAARYLKQFGASARIDDQPWDVSVKAIAHYPDVLFMMDQKYDWTVSLGQAFVDQPQDVMDSIQALRAEAQAQGNLVSTREQEVIVEPGDIRIVPVSPEYIYVPVYDPQVVYLERPDPSYGFISFGVGLSIGAWLSRDLDWREHRVYDHGWRDGGWVGRSRPHIRDRGGVYINKPSTVININEKVRQRDTNRFRQELRHDVERRRELPGRPAPTPRLNQPRPPRTEPGRSPRVDQPRQPASVQPRPPATAIQPRPPVTGQQPRPATRPGPPATGSPDARPSVRDVFRGRDVQKEQPASRSGYGGYGSGKDATIYRERGQTSREKMRQPNRPAPVRQPAAPAAPRPSVAPAPRSNVAPAPRQIVPHVPRPTTLPAPRPSAAPAPRPNVTPAPRPAAPEGRGGREQRQERQ